jgi:murein DD-endopeptidase MepM/ murein hydrolase activator NlpD
MKKSTAKKRRTIYAFGFIVFLIILFLVGWFFAILFEGEKPSISLEPLPEFFTKIQEFNLNISDRKRGLKQLTISVKQGGREINVLKKEFPFNGLLNRQGVHQYKKEIFIDPLVLNLAQGRADLYVQVWDYSRRGGGDGNHSLVQHKMIIDTIPPAIRAISRQHNINKGGVGLIVYQTSSDTGESGVFVDDHFSPGFPVNEKSQKGIHVSYFALSYNAGKTPKIYLWAKDMAGNASKTTFYVHVRNKTFRKERLTISDRFLERILPYFSFYPFDPGESDIKKFLIINSDLRKENHKIFLKVAETTQPDKLWEGSFLRLKNAATMARFADLRSYYYKGKKIDEQGHFGMDLASLPSSPIQAANNGKVVFADRLGIYGLTVVLDHGQGLASIYAHMSKINVPLGQEVKKGESIGFTGQTGLAAGDHLHFGIMVNGVFVNPIEWFDGHWIKDNISRKLALIK